MFIQSNPGAHRIIASEPGFLIPHLIKYSYIEIKNPSNLTILLEIFAELTCSEDIIDYLLEEKILSILCDILISDNPDDIKCKSLTILHHIASKGESYCFKQFEEVQLASDPSRRASPIQCVIYVIDEQSTGKSNAEFPELQAYLCSPDARQFATDEDNVRLQKLCLKFLTALVSKKQLPYNSLLSEILEHIVKCTFIREPSIRHISLYSCIDCSENYFDYFSNFFKKYSCYTHFINLLVADQVLVSEDKANILYIFQSILSNNPQETETFLRLNFVSDVHDYIDNPQNNISIQEQIVWCGILTLLLEFPIEYHPNYNLVEMYLELGIVDIMYFRICEGSIRIKMEALLLFNQLIKCDNEILGVFDEKCPLLFENAIEIAECDNVDRDALIETLNIVETLIKHLMDNQEFERIQAVVEENCFENALCEIIDQMPISVSVKAKRVLSLLQDDEAPEDEEM
ncbi:hypothetical protein GPJ56_010302 [Histomonas meleagridis]|uniref:uncharacterized protein n=1 Tax=Histomonas meleagridis TaxID=135588 RepID=UPI00355A3D3F|nr:hypothetical protein GPJ56_010302 [Histomonas meleagridis]KAH0797909.1 hypothetical protein GO595_009538 [Histomonas meleagridis]